MAQEGSGNLREFRIQKKPSFSHHNGALDSSTEHSPVVAVPGKRRILTIPDSDSDCDQPQNQQQQQKIIVIQKANSQQLATPQRVIVQQVVKPQQQQVATGSGSGPSPRAERIAERERMVRYMIKNFPDVESFEIYEMLSKYNFNLELAVQEIRKVKGITRTLTDYQQWKEEAQPNNTLSRPVQEGLKRRVVHEVSQKPKVKRRRIDNRDEDSNDSLPEKYKDNRVFDSDEDSDVEITNELTGDKKRVLEFMQTATPNELQLMSSCSKKKIDAILASRPFKGWIDLVEKLQSNKNLSTDLLNAAQRVLITRNNVKQLMRKCGNIATQLEYAVQTGGGVKQQPSMLTRSLRLTSYQMVGLNWLAILQEQGVNGILADEMGLGKTVQVIAFLAHLKQMKMAKTTHLVVVPASTLENWQNEFVRWCPELRVLLYYGSAEERRSYRIMFAEGKHRDFDVVLTTYTMVSSSPEERKMFRVTPMHYVIFDEAHMLKNMNTQRYETLARIKASKRILLTGTPLQNNLLELMSLLIFVMPNIFSEKAEDLKSLFQKNSKKDKENEDLPAFEREQIEQAKRIMKPFVLRRLKSDVLQDLPKKTDLKLEIELVPSQKEQYKNLVAHFQQAGKDGEPACNGVAMMTELRKLANHPLLLRYHYKDKDLPGIAKRLANDPDYKDTVEQYIIDDLACMSDFEIHTMSKSYKCLSKYQLPEKLLTISGKFQFLDKKLAELKSGGHRVLIFSQYVIMLNVMEEYLNIRDHSYLRLDGNTPVTIRQQLIDEYTETNEIFIFLLSTKAGGLGINLTAADTVIIHDIDFNPYNDKQAEDRCHRMGQTKPVTVHRLISKGTIEEGMWALTQEKLKLEKEITSDDYENTDVKSVVTLLSSALNMDTEKVSSLVSPQKC